MKDKMIAGADKRKVKAALNRTMKICRKNGFFETAQKAVKAKMFLGFAK